MWEIQEGSSADGKRSFSLYQILSTEAFESISGGTFPITNMCCVCGLSSSNLQCAWPLTVRDRVEAWWNGPRRVNVPVCQLHSKPPVPFIIDAGCWRTASPYVFVCSLSEAFVVAFKDTVLSGEIAPPWTVYPERSPSLGGEDFNRLWLPTWEASWKRKSRQVKDDYLAKWGTRDDWEQHYRRIGIW